METFQKKKKIIAIICNSTRCTYRQRLPLRGSVNNSNPRDKKGEHKAFRLRKQIENSKLCRECRTWLACEEGHYFNRMLCSCYTVRTLKASAMDAKKFSIMWFLYALRNLFLLVTATDNFISIWWWWGERAIQICGINLENKKKFGIGR